LDLEGGGYGSKGFEERFPCWLVVVDLGFAAVSDGPSEVDTAMMLVVVNTGLGAELTDRV